LAAKYYKVLFYYKLIFFNILLALWTSNKYLTGPMGQLKNLCSQRLYMIYCGHRLQLNEIYYNKIALWHPSQVKSYYGDDKIRKINEFQYLHIYKNISWNGNDKFRF